MDLERKNFILHGQAIFGQHFEFQPGIHHIQAFKDLVHSILYFISIYRIFISHVMRSSE